jgi:type II secretory pathway pseudopilin PulG
MTPGKRSGTGSCGRPGGRAERGGAAGYSLVMMVMLITVLNIMVAIALPLWSGMIRRDKEEELIARGLQYAEAIRVFQRRFGRLPVQLDELIKVEPRSIRRLWEDPMTGKADWILIFEGTPPGGAGSPGIDPQTGLPLPPAGNDPQNPQGSAEDENLPPPVGPIRGVRSRATGEAFKVFLDQSDYSAWEFRSDLFSRFRAAPSENGIPRVSALTLGRPFRYTNPGTGQGPGQFPVPGGPGKPAPGPAKPTLRSQPSPPNAGEKQ